MDANAIVGPILTAINDLRDEVRENRKAIRALEKKVDANTQAIRTLEGRVNSLEQRTTS